MDTLNTITGDIVLESFRAAVVLTLFGFVYITGTRTLQHNIQGWNMIIGGFGLLLFASVWDITDNFTSLNRFVVVGDTPVQAMLEEVVGYLGGFVLLLLGILRWLPLVFEGAKAEHRQELADIQERYKSLVELSPDAILLHFEGKIIYANQAAANLAEADDPSQLVGKSSFNLVHPSYHDQTHERLRALSDGNVERQPLIDMKVLTLQNHVRDVEVASCMTTFMGKRVYQSVLRDVSDRVKAEAALMESERELRSIFDNMAEFFYRTDTDGVIVRASGAARDISGWDSDEIIGLKLADRYVDPQGREKFLSALKHAGGVLRNFEAQLIRRDGERIWVSTNARFYRNTKGDICGVEGTVRDITEAVQARDVLQHMAMHDVLTGLGNRRSFEIQLKNALARARRVEATGAVLYFDLDGFKTVNDTHNHDVGDTVLRLVGKRLQSFVRETDFVARIGGDEFCLIVEGAHDNKAAKTVAEKLIATIIEPYHVDSHTLTIGVSVGIMPFTGNEQGDSDTDAVHHLITHADKAMYSAKSAGGNRYHVAEPLLGILI